ncbi:hypothetical protein BJV77DRAFT_1150809 [Russula vinacea]|nr:hypothetical protein BJV77DRAFT_1150809 [Russula vinacea]
MASSTSPRHLWPLGISRPSRVMWGERAEILSTMGKISCPSLFDGERLMGVQGIMDSSHFGVDEKGNTVIMGFGSISFLPESFACYTLHCTETFATLPRTLAWSGASNMTSMVAIAHALGMTADPRLGLNDKGEDVNKKATAKRRKRGDALQVEGGN